jgi:hypothetical protein
MLAGRAVMINWSDVAAEHRPAYYEWYSREHMVGRVKIPGFRRGRRYIAARAGRDFLVCYEVDDIGVLMSEAYLAKANAPSALTQKTTPFIRNSNRALATVRATFGTGTGGCALTLRFDPRPGSEEGLARYLMEEALPALAKIPEIAGAHFAVSDEKASTIVPAERKGRPTVIPNWIVILEGISLEALDDACDALLPEASLRARGCEGAVERDTYRLEIMLTKFGDEVR